MEARARAAIRAAGHDPDRNVRFHRYPTTDAWCRDHGPIFVVKPDGSRALCDFGFDNWGKKYPGWELDDAVPRHVEKILGLPRFPADMVLEGGGIEGDGQGTVITTESCLLNPNRGPGRTRERMEKLLADFLGAKHVVWLHDGIEGDDTDGHIDDLVRFVAPGIVVAVTCDDTERSQLRPARREPQAPRGAIDATGRALTVIDLPMPPAHRDGRLPQPGQPRQLLHRQRRRPAPGLRRPVGRDRRVHPEGTVPLPQHRSDPLQRNRLRLRRDPLRDAAGARRPLTS